VKKIEPFEVIFENENIIAVNKVSGIAVCADRWDDSKERLDRLVGALPGAGKIFIIHRIDRDTSGLVVFAKNSDTHKKLSAAFEGRKIVKRYLAVIRGRPAWKETVCDLPLVPDGNKKHLTIIDKYQGKKSLTRFRLLCTAGNYSIVEAIPETGRTHQIRVHLASMGHSVVCDEFYGNTKPLFLSAIKSGWRGNPAEERPLLARLGLHAAELLIPDFFAAAASAPADMTPAGAVAAAETAAPADTAAGIAAGRDLLLRAPVPRDMAALINQMEKCSGVSFNDSLFGGAVS